MKKFLALMLSALMLAACLTACSGTGDGGDTTTGGAAPQVDLTGTYNITMWVSEKEGVSALFQQQIDAFEAANPGIVINAQIEGVTEADAGSLVVNDVATAPDIYCFAQDQLARLVQAAALAAPGKAAAENIIASNDAGSVAAATVAGTLYAYPMTSDNGYYMYYDKSIISDEDAESLEKIIAACEAKGVKFRYALENAWYTASFFFATGCHSNWTMDAEGNFNAVDDTFNSAAGLAAMKGMQKLAKSTCYDSNADIFTDAGVVITGIWNANAAAEHFGENLGATDLPSFEVDGKSYHLGSYTGNKLMGVKPQSDQKKAAVLALLEDVQAPQPQEELVRRELEHTMEILLSTLNDRQQQILRLHFGMEDGTCHSLEEIGSTMGISKERARQIEKQAMDKLQRLGASMGLEDFLNDGN